MNKFKALYIALLLLICNVSYTQNQLFHSDHKLTVELEIIGNLIHQKIDSLRVRKRLNKLKGNFFLTKAAQLHADWMLDKDKFTHIQNKSKTKTPQKRVDFVGGDGFFIGENIAYTLYGIELKSKKGKRYINQSYEAIANDLVQMWKHSRGHYKNIMTKGYRTTGIALSVDFENNKIYAVQVFGGK